MNGLFLAAFFLAGFGFRELVRAVSRLSRADKHEGPTR